MILDFKPPSTKLEFKKFKFDKYVNKYVYFRLNLRRDVEIQLEETRHKCLLEFRRFDQAGTIPPDGIRLGMDFLESPTTLEHFQNCSINKTYLGDCLARSYAAIELGVSQAVVHFASDYTNRRDHHEDEPPRLPQRCSVHTDSELTDICLDTNKKIRAEMYSAFNLGKMDGFEDGRSMLTIVLGKNPSDSCWYPYIEQGDKRWLEQKDDPAVETAFEKVPIKVELRTERRDLFTRRLDSGMKFVSLVEAVTQNLLILRLRFFLAGKKQEPVNIYSFNQMETVVRERLERAMDDAKWT